MKKIKKECLKNMVAGPSLIDTIQPNLKVPKYACLKKDSVVSQASLKSHKNSFVGHCYNSDSEDVKHQDH